MLATGPAGNGQVTVQFTLGDTSTTVSGGQPLEGTIRDFGIAHDQVIAEFNNDVEQANKALTSGDSTVRFVGQIVAVAMKQPSIGPVTIGPDNKLTFVVDGATASTRLESTIDFKTWRERVADRVTSGTQVRFTVEPSGVLEFLRVVQ